MNVTITCPIQVLDSTEQQRLREKFLTVEPGTYDLIEIPNPYRPGIPFFALPGTRAGAVALWWRIRAQHSSVRINSGDESGFLSQEQVFMLLTELAHPACLPKHKLAFFKKLFPEYTERDTVLQNPALSKNLIAGILHNLLNENISTDPNDILGLFPLIVAVLCERVSAPPFATVDWESLKRLKLQSLN